MKNGALVVLKKELARFFGDKRLFFTESGKTLAVKDASGNTLGSIKLPSALSGYGVVFSAPGITQGTTYKLMSDSSELYSFTCSGQVTSAGSSTGMGGPGGGPGGGFGRP